MSTDVLSAHNRNLSPLRRILPYLAPYKLAVLGAAVALIIAAGTVLAIGSGLKAVIDRGLAAGNPAMLDQTLIVMLGVIIVLALATYARFSLVSWLGERVVADMRRDVFNHILKLDVGFFETTRAGDIISRLTTDTSILQTVVGSSISMALRNALLLIGGLVMLMTTSPRMTLMVLIAVPIVIIPIIIFGRRVRKLSKISQEKISEVTAYADEAVHGIKTVQAFTHEIYDQNLFMGHIETTVKAAVKRIRARALLTMSVIFLAFSAIGVILWIGGHDVLAGRVSPGELSAFIFYAVLVAGAVAAISEVYGDLQRAAGAMERIFELLNVRPNIIAPAAPRPLPDPLAGHIAFRKVTFSYPSRPDLPALHDISFDVKPGERVAIVGPSGAGKTTLFQLLLRFYDPQHGSVFLDDLDIRQADPADVRRQIGLVAQDPTIFAADVWSNIAYGRPHATRDEILAAAEAAHASEFIEKMPQGMDTFLGERGVRLSGGQKQRISIARALLRNPPILLLDEATSALDSESERLVQEAFEKVMKGRTTLIIAHRLATVMNADRTIVMDQGRIVAVGPHRELIRQGGLYARLAELQFRNAPLDRTGTI